MLEAQMCLYTNQILVLILKRALTSACKYKHTQGVFTGIKMGTAAPWINKKNKTKKQENRFQETNIIIPVTYSVPN